MIRVFIADDHQMFVDGIELMLQEATGYELVGKSNSGKGVVSWLEQHTADVVLLDIDMPDMGAEDTIEIIRKRGKEVKVLIVTMHDEGPYIKKYMDLDVHGYVLKNTNKQELLLAIRRVHEGRQYFGSDLIKKVSLLDLSSVSVQEEEDPLTSREKEIMRLTANDLSIPQIADQLCISVNTVKTHRKNIQHKIDAKSLSGIIRYAIEHGLADPVD